MPGNRRTYQAYWKPLRNLLKRIDLAVDDYVSRDHDKRTYKEILRTPDCLESLLHSLERYHPLNWIVRRHGKRVYDRVYLDYPNPQKDWSMEESVKVAFQLRDDIKDRGALKRDFSRIIKSISEPLERLFDRIVALCVMIREMGKK